MNIKGTMSALLKIVFLIVFNALFFILAGADHPISVWISYAMINISYFMMIATPLLVSRSHSSYLFGLTLASISSVYFTTEFILGIFIILIRPSGFKVPVVIQILLGGIYAVMLLSNMLANEVTAEDENRRREEILAIKEMALGLKQLMDKVEDKEANKMIERAYDYVHASPVKSNERAKQLERQVVQYMYDLKTAATKGDTKQIIALSKSIIEAMEERNRRLN